MKRMIYLGCMMTLALLGCGEDTVAPPPPEDAPPVAPDPFEWRHTQRTPVSELLHDVDGFADVHLAVGEGGTVLFKHGSDDWTLLDERLEGSRLEQVEMIGEKTAIVLGGSRIYRTADGGLTWKEVASAGSALRDVSMHGDAGIAVGTSVMLLTDDEGETWAPAPSFPPGTYTAVGHLTAQRAIATTIGQVMYRTEDGGASWETIALTQIPDRVEHLVFYTDKLGTAATSGPTHVYWTDDAGDTWSERASFGEGSIRRLDKIDDETAYAVLGTGQVHVTRDAGKSWAFETLIFQPEGEVTGIDISDDAQWFAVGSFGFLSETRNTGTTWNRLTEGRVGVFRSIAFLDETDGIAAYDPRFAETETALVTGDGGATWVPVDPAISRPVRAIGSDLGVALMIGGEEVSLSTNRGLSWTNVSPPAEDGLRGGAIIDALTYVVCGRNSTAFRTTDGGASWEDVSGGRSGDDWLDVAFFPDGTTGVIASPDDSFRSTDGGVTWDAINLRAEAVAVLDENVAVAVGEQILRSTDRGLTWSIVFTPRLPLDAVAFTDALHGIAVGPLGLLLETLDGGLTWEEVERETSVSLRTVTPRGEAGAVVGGDAGAILMGTP